MIGDRLVVGNGIEIIVVVHLVTEEVDCVRVGVCVCERVRDLFLLLLKRLDKFRDFLVLKIDAFFFGKRQTCLYQCSI